MPRQPYITFDQSVFRPVVHPVSKKGVAPDRPHESLNNEFLASALNILIRRGRPRQREGFNAYYPSGMTAGTFPGRSVAFFEFISTRSPASALVVTATRTNFYFHQPGATGWTDITTTARTGALDNPVFFASFLNASTGQRIVSVNGVDNPAHWSGATNTAFVVLTTAVIGACVIPWKGHLLLGDTTDTADGAIITRIRWSALGDAATWSGTASAGSLDLTDSNATKVMNLVPMRSVLAAYKEEGVHALIYRAAPFYFTQSIMHPLISTISRRAIAPIDTGERHFVMTKDGAILWDGQIVRPIGRDRVDKTILASLNWEARQTIWARWWPLDNEIWMGIPTGSSTVPNAVWVYNLSEDGWWETNLPWLIAEPLSLQNSAVTMVVGHKATANPYNGFSGHADDVGASQVAISSSIQLGMYDYGAVQHKQVFRCDVIASPGEGPDFPTRQVSFPATLLVKHATQHLPLIAPSFSTGQQLIINDNGASTQVPHIDLTLTSRWWSYRIEHTALNETFAMTALIPHLVERTGRD